MKKICLNWFYSIWPCIVELACVFRALFIFTTAIYAGILTIQGLCQWLLLMPPLLSSGLFLLCISYGAWSIRRAGPSRKVTAPQEPKAKKKEIYRPPNNHIFFTYFETREMALSALRTWPLVENKDWMSPIFKTKNGKLYGFVTPVERSMPQGETMVSYHRKEFVFGQKS